MPTFLVTVRFQTNAGLPDAYTTQVEADDTPDAIDKATEELRKRRDDVRTIFAGDVTTLLPRSKTKAYDVTIRRLANGCDFHYRLFAVDKVTAADRAMERARIACKIARTKYSELHGQGIAVFRTVSCQLSADQSRPND